MQARDKHISQAGPALREGTLAQIFLSIYEMQ